MIDSFISAAEKNPEEAKMAPRTFHSARLCFFDRFAGSAAAAAESKLLQ